MTREQLNQSGFIFVANEKSIEPITYQDYLNEFGKDECTAPHGVADRMHIREVENEDGEARFEIWSWGTGGNHPYYTGEQFDNEEDAILFYYDRSEWYVQEKNWNAPRFCYSYEDAVTEMANTLDKSEDVIRRYIALSVITARKAAEHRAMITKQHEERKAWLAVEVPREAATLPIDDEFRAAVKWSEEARGQEKSVRMASAMKGLLARNGKEKIETDFWQVARILKAQA